MIALRRCEVSRAMGTTKGEEGPTIISNFLFFFSFFLSLLLAFFFSSHHDTRSGSRVSSILIGGFGPDETGMRIDEGIYIQSVGTYMVHKNRMR